MTIQVKMLLLFLLMDFDAIGKSVVNYQTVCNLAIESHLAVVIIFTTMAQIITRARSD